MTDLTFGAGFSPTDVFQEPACSFCGTPAKDCRALIANELRTAFICEVCAPIAAAQARDVIAVQDEKAGGPQ